MEKHCISDSSTGPNLVPCYPKCELHPNYSFQTIIILLAELLLESQTIGQSWRYAHCLCFISVVVLWRWRHTQSIMVGELSISPFLLLLLFLYYSFHISRCSRSLRRKEGRNMSYLIMCTQLSLVCFHDKIRALRIFMSTCFF